MTKEGPGIVEDVNVLRETATVRLDRGGEADLAVYKVEEITFARPAQKQQDSCGKCPKDKCPNKSAPKEDADAHPVQEP